MINVVFLDPKKITIFRIIVPPFPATFKEEEEKEGFCLVNSIIYLPNLMLKQN
jgi:hypothetical protein